MNKTLPTASENFFITKTCQYLYNTKGNSFDVVQVKTTTYRSIHITCNSCMEFLPQQSQHHYIAP